MLRLSRLRPELVFLLVFGLLLVLYWPARSCGWVSDTLGWLDAVQRQSFGDFINRRGFRVQSLYQTTQLATWTFYQLFGRNALAWHLLQLGLQALNAALLFVFFRNLLSDFNLERPAATALAAALLFSLSPSLSEVLVWEAAYHYLQGLLFILLQLLLLQGFLRNGRKSLSWIGGVIFAIASFSLELFYLSPVLSLLLLLLYRFGRPRAAADRIRSASRAFLLPQLAMLAAHLLLLRICYGSSAGRLGDGLWQHPLSYFAIKPPDYVLHLAGGRFLPQAFRSAWHGAFCTYIGAGIFYAVLAASLSFILLRFRRMSARAQVLSWAWCATLAAMALVTPMWFPERLLVMGDRYLYIMLPFAMLMPSLLLAQIRGALLRSLLILLLCGASAAGVRILARMWERSEGITAAMQLRLPRIADGRTLLILNSPANYCGIPMTGAGPEGEFALRRRLLFDGRFARDGVRETFAAEYGDGACSVRRISKSRYLVTLANPQARWWFGPDYASDYSNGGWNARIAGSRSYELSVRPGAMFRLAVWTGAGFRFLPDTE